jgi:Rad3-related DNA helicase
MSGQITSPAPPGFLMTPFAPALAAGEQTETFARFLAEAAAPFTDRGVLVFCPSQTGLRALHAALRNVLGRAPEADAPARPVSVWAQFIDGNRDAIVRLYASGRGGFVLATEGLPGLRDTDGNAPGLWVLTRMPLPPPHDPLLEARGEVLREQGINARLELWHPAAVLRIKLDWAALCRSGEQSAPRTIWLLDARAATEGLGVRMAGALGCEAIAVKDMAELKEKTASMGNGQWAMSNGQTAL